MAALQEQMEQLEQDEIEALGRIAKEADLIGLDIPEKQLKEAFKEIAARFSNPKASMANAPS